MSLPDIVFNKIYRIVDTVPYVGTIYAISRAVWYGFQGDMKEVAISAVNAIQGSVGDILLFRRIAEPFKISVIRTMVQNASDMIVEESFLFDWLKNKKVNKDGIDPRTVLQVLEEKIKLLEYKFIDEITSDDRDKIDFDNEHCVFVSHENDEEKSTTEMCFEEMWHRAIIHGSSYSGVVTYDSYMNKNMIVIAFPNGLNLNTPVNIFLHWDKNYANTRQKFVMANNGILKYDEAKRQYHFLKGNEYYWFKFYTNPLRIKNNVNEDKTILQFGKLNLFIADKYNNIVATTDLQINIANNIRIIHLKTGLAFTFDINDKTYEVKLKNINFKKDKQISQLWEVEFFRDNNYRLRSFVSSAAQRMYCIGENLQMWDFVNYFWDLEKVDFIDE
ncbi:2781_t:CDS:2 [Dentiscutata heterogama]|uniref:2781_t:CDS:1 n=1 Tax=Dentiscutata heterogama TaxID=1316150 RepID=A0ACA9LBK8_9GLOM|nr:2781_t:CDS:2 [Dentiscutata heterogama]